MVTSSSLAICVCTGYSRVLAIQFRLGDCAKSIEWRAKFNGRTWKLRGSTIMQLLRFFLPLPLSTVDAVIFDVSLQISPCNGGVFSSAASASNDEKPPPPTGTPNTTANIALTHTIGHLLLLLLFIHLHTHLNQFFFFAFLRPHHIFNAFSSSSSRTRESITQVGISISSHVFLFSAKKIMQIEKTNALLSMQKWVVRFCILPYHAIAAM